MATAIIWVSLGLVFLGISWACEVPFRIHLKKWRIFLVLITMVWGLYLFFGGLQLITFHLTGFEP